VRLKNNKGLNGGEQRRLGRVLRSSACTNYQPEASSPLCLHCNGWPWEHRTRADCASKPSGSASIQNQETEPKAGS
jgi:hypothetical protein